MGWWTTRSTATTGFLVTEDNIDRFSIEDIDEWEDALDGYYALHGEPDAPE